MNLAPAKARLSAPLHARRRLLPLALSLLLLIAQQLGTQHLLAHVLQLDGHGHGGQTQATLAGSPAIPDGPATQAEAGDRANLVVRPLSPRLYRKLAIVIRRDKVLHLGLRETIRALKGLAKAP